MAKLDHRPLALDLSTGTGMIRHAEESVRTRFDGYEENDHSPG